MKLRNIVSLLLLLLFIQSCGKQWLEAKPDKSLIVPKTIQDFQALLDNSSLVFNITQPCGLSEISAGDFYISYASWQLLFTKAEKSAYIWEQTASFYKGESSFDWTEAYKRILNANVILEGIQKITPNSAEQQDWNRVKGSALFFRAFDFFNLAQEYCVAYTPSQTSESLGLPLRLEYDVNVKSKRSNLQQTYEQILSDLNEAGNLLNSKPKFKTQPSKEAVYALLARVYLTMENYNEAGFYAEAALKIQSELLNYAKLNAASAFPIAKFNPEVIFQSVFTYGIFNQSRLIVEPDLYNGYSTEDCRKTVFFATNVNGITYKGSYNGDRNLFGGLSTNELYLIRAECNARSGKTKQALADLNLLLQNRWKSNYQDLAIADQEVLLAYILKERRKELVFRGIRWQDLRRLNKDNRFAVTLTRTLNGITYTLKPGDKRYVLPIDEEEIRLSGIEQNDRN